MPRRRKIKKKKKLPLAPTKAIEDSNERYIVTMFADIVGCSEISNHKSLKEYSDFVKDFQNCFEKVCEHYKKEEYKEEEHPFFKAEVRGDEGCLMIFGSRDDDSLARDIDTTINIALDLKRMWLFKNDNIKRIKDDRLLPVDIGIGIHTGKVYLNKEGNKLQPEGYAINLAKRIESASRDGKFTHILISESARGLLYSLKDEYTYRFDMPFAIQPRGISREVKVFEIKHHFLPTDWQDIPSEVSIIYEQLDDDKVNIIKVAYDANPTNLWLAEEYLLLDMMNEYRKLCDEDEEDNPERLKTAYFSAYNTAQHIANNELRDAGLLGIWGFIAGEQKNFVDEQKRYQEALRLDDQDGDIHWYLAYSLSSELHEQYDKVKEDKSIIEFYNDEKCKERVKEISHEFERAFELRPMNPWIVYDHASELSWWSQADKGMSKKAIDLLIKAFSLNAKTKKSAKNEEYLKPIIEDDRVKRLLGKTE